MWSSIYSDGVTDGRNMREELYDSRDQRRLLKRLAESPGRPEAVGRSILQEIREFSTGHAQTDDITLICFGPSRLDESRRDVPEARQSPPRTR